MVLAPIATLKERAAAALAEFLRLESAGGVLLLGMAMLGLAAANSPLAMLYGRLLSLPFTVKLGSLGVDKPLLLWINDGLMAVFFLLVALELKREILQGQFSERAQIALPAMCAAGGMVMPMLIYAALSRGNAEAMAGVAIPAATDIAFALAILALLGDRPPAGGFAMNNILNRVKHEVLEVIPPAVFFFIAFQVIAFTRALMLEQYGIRVTTFITATIAALVVAKVVLIADMIPWINRFPERPLIYNVAWKTFVYIVIALFVRYVEHLIPFIREHGSLTVAKRQLLHEVALFLGDSDMASGTFFLLCAFRELVRVIGRHRVIQIFFGHRGAHNV